MLIIIVPLYRYFLYSKFLKFDFFIYFAQFFYRKSPGQIRPGPSYYFLLFHYNTAAGFLFAYSNGNRCTASLYCHQFSSAGDAYDVLVRGLVSYRIRRILRSHGCSQLEACASLKRQACPVQFHADGGYFFLHRHFDSSVFLALQRYSDNRCSSFLTGDSSVLIHGSYRFVGSFPTVDPVAVRISYLRCAYAGTCNNTYTLSCHGNFGCQFFDRPALLISAYGTTALFFSCCKYSGCFHSLVSSICMFASCLDGCFIPVSPQVAGSSMIVL